MKFTRIVKYSQDGKDTWEYSVNGSPTRIEHVSDIILSRERLARAILEFHDPGPWDNEKALRWAELSRNRPATTKTLGDMAREVLAAWKKEDDDEH